MPSKEAPQPKFMMLGKSKYVHVVRTKAWDRKNSECQQVRKYLVADNIPYGKGKGISPEAASALDPCPNCDTAGVIKSMTTPAQRKAASKAAREETLEHLKEAAKTDGQRKKDAKKKAKKAPVGVDKRKGRKHGGGGGSKRTAKSQGGDREKAEALAAFAKEHGWETTVDPADPGLVVVAVRGAETIQCWFVDGKYDTARHAKLIVGNWTGKLRGVHGCRKQMANEGRDRPHPKPGVGRSAPRKGKGNKADDEVIPEDESPEDAKRRVPFSIDDPDIDIIDAIKGKTIRWRNGVSNSIEEAWLPSAVRPKRGSREAKRDVITITTHPKKKTRMVTFLTVLSVSSEDGEQYGPERTVALDKIVRVVA